MHTFEQSVFARLYLITIYHHKRQVIYILSKQTNIPLEDTFDAHIYIEVRVHQMYNFVFKSKHCLMHIFSKKVIIPLMHMCTQFFFSFDAHIYIDVRLSPNIRINV